MSKTLIVDDNASYRQSFKELLCKHFPSMIVAEAAGINEGMEKIQSVRPDLIFIDIELAGESGLELTRKIRNDYADIPIAILTNYDLPEFRQAAQESGASYFFSKSSSTMDEVILAIKTTEAEGGDR